MTNHFLRKCEPVCHQGCVKGSCVKPEHCQCDFGYVGKNCSVECLCNKHSNCKSVTETSTCLKCENNTTVRTKCFTVQIKYVNCKILTVTSTFLKQNDSHLFQIWFLCMHNPSQKKKNLNYWLFFTLKIKNEYHLSLHLL